MRNRVAVTVTVVLAAVAQVLRPAPGLAQSAEAYAGWVGLVSTPVGGLTPSAPGSAPVRWGLQARWGHWQFAKDDDNTTNLALGVTFGLGRGRAAVEVGRQTKKTCQDCDGILLGLETEIPVVTPGAGEDRVVAVSINPAAGYMFETADESDFSSLGVAVRVPVSMNLSLGKTGSLVPFLSPGGGMGRLSSGGASKAGLRFLLGGGLGLRMSSGLETTVSFSKIFIDRGATVFGVALGFAR